MSSLQSSPVNDRPPDLLYAADEKPPVSETFLLGLQHTGIVATAFIFPILVARAAGLEAGATAFFVSMSMLANGISTIFQAFRYPGFGSGFLIPRVAGPNFVSASVLAIHTGGLALLSGMTVASGLILTGLSRVVHKLRILFPVEVTGLVIMMLGVTVVPYALPNFFGIEGQGSLNPEATLISIATLGVTVAITVWGRGRMTLFPVIIGMAFGYVICVLTGNVSSSEIGTITSSSLVAVPDTRYFGLAFQPELLIPFGIAMLTTFVKDIGEFSMCQRINDTSWKRPDMTNVRSGLLADGVASTLGGIIGGMGQTGSSSNIGLSIATRATSRYIGYATGAILIFLAFLPILASVFIIMPGPVIGGALIYVAGFIIVSGFQMITTRMLDSRKVFVIGLSFIFGMSVAFLPGAYQGVPALIRPIFDSPQSLTTVVAISLNLVFRIGIKKKIESTIDPAAGISGQVFTLLERQGEQWGARKEAIFRMETALIEAAEVISGNLLTSGPIRVSVSFDEYNLNGELSWEGRKLEIPDRSPGEEEMIEDPDAVVRLGGYLVRSHADQVQSTTEGTTSRLKVHIDH